MAEDLASVRHQLIKLAGRKKTRQPDPIRRDWKPGDVVDPETGQPFTPVGAWEFIVRLLADDKQPLEEVTQDNPPGKKAYVMHVQLAEKRLYIKLRLGTGCVLGRSFHYSEKREQNVQDNQE